MRNDANCIRPTLDTIAAAMFRLQDLEASSRDIADHVTANVARMEIKRLSECEGRLMRHAAELPGFFGVS
ncbi:hypothetical protein WH95_18420 [Kiloniella litopenaei]|uniref:Uncharacterized protein n=1 Tax=Kiloniella litopenaei TaxID=1549748 RepID=A0A0M2R0J9_9PROT|nr:hypothetical protein WH95_18420 [Kiloniella litopenaei]